MSIYDYDVIGFDMDYSLLEYDFTRLQSLQWKFITEHMNKQGYPHLPKYEEVRDKAKQFQIKGVVDQVNGTVLKIGAAGEVMIAYKGFRKLDRNEVESLYQGRKIDLNFNLQKFNDKEQFQLVVDYFRAGSLCLFVFYVDLKENGAHFLAEKSY